MCARRQRRSGGVSKVRGARVPDKIFFKNNFPTAVKITTSGYQTQNVLLQHSQRGECMGVLCTWVKLLTYLQTLGCELHKNAFGGTHWRSYSTSTDPLAVMGRREGQSWE